MDVAEEGPSSSQKDTEKEVEPGKGSELDEDPAKKEEVDEAKAARPFKVFFQVFFAE
jgi:hypothetical protein